MVSTKEGQSTWEWLVWEIEQGEFQMLILGTSSLIPTKSIHKNG